MEAIFNIYKACPEAMSILTMFVMAIVVAIVQYWRKRQSWGIFLLPMSLLMTVPFYEVWETGKAMREHPEAVEVFTNHGLRNALINADHVWHNPSPEKLVQMYHRYQFYSDFHCRIARSGGAYELDPVTPAHDWMLDTPGKVLRCTCPSTIILDNGEKYQYMNVLYLCYKEPKKRPDWLYNWKKPEDPSWNMAFKF